MNEEYLALRSKVFEVTNDDLNLDLENNQQVYLSVIDVPVKNSEGIVESTMTLALQFDDEISIHVSDGRNYFDLDFDKNIAESALIFLTVFEQIFDSLEEAKNIEFFESDFERIYLKTSDKIYLMVLDKETRETQFIGGLLDDLLKLCVSHIQKLT